MWNRLVSVSIGLALIAAGCGDNDDGDVGAEADLQLSTSSLGEMYYFVNDATAGDTNGQGVNDVWFVLDGTGDAVGSG